MNQGPKRILDLLFVACCVLAGCRAEQQAPAGSEAAERATLAEAGDSLFSPSAQRVSLPSDRIYFTLTSHEWYARGEPLMYEGRAYRPAGMPVAASLTEMAELGEFQGVDFYGRSGDGPVAVYVPVYEGYWQVFRTDAEAIDTTTAAPPPPDPDSIPAR